MSMPMEDVQPIDDFEPTIFDMFWVDAFKPKLCHEKDILVVTFFATHPQDAEELSRHIVRSPANIVSVETSTDPDEDGFYIVIVELDRQKEMFNELTVMLETIQPLVQLDNWYFKPFDYDQYFLWNERNFIDTVPQDPEAFAAQQVDIFVTAETDDDESDDAAEPFSQHTVEAGTADLSTFSQSLNKELRKQFSHLIKLNQRLLRKFDQLQTDHKYLQRQLKLYQKREKLALMRERQDLQRIRRLEGELSMLAYSGMNRQDVVINEAENRFDAVTGRKALQGTYESKDHEVDEVTRGPAAGDPGQPLDDRDMEPGVNPVQADPTEAVDSKSTLHEPIADGQAPATDIDENPTDTEEIIDLEDPLYSDTAPETASDTESDDPMPQNPDREASSGATGPGHTSESAHMPVPETMPADDQSAFALGMAALKAKHYDAAIDCFSNVEEDSEDAPRGFYNLAVLYYMRRNYEAANHYAELALERGILSAEQILEFSRNKQQELQERMQAQAAENDTPTGMDESGNALQDANGQSSAGDDPGQNGEPLPGDEPIEVSDADIPVDDTAHPAGQPVESDNMDSDEEHIIELDASTEVSGSLTTEQGRGLDTAVERSAEAAETVADPPPAEQSNLQAESDLDAYYYALGQAALEQGDMPTAIDYFSAVEKTAHQAPTSRYYLAILYMRSNMYDQARLRAIEAREMGVARAQKILDLIEKHSAQSASTERPVVDIEAPDRAPSEPVDASTYGNAAAQTDLAPPPKQNKDADPYPAEEKVDRAVYDSTDAGVGIDDSANNLPDPIEDQSDSDTAGEKDDPWPRPPEEMPDTGTDVTAEWEGEQPQVPDDVEEKAPDDGKAPHGYRQPAAETLEPAPAADAGAMDDQTDRSPEVRSQGFEPAEQDDEPYDAKIEPDGQIPDAERRPVPVGRLMPEEDVLASVAAEQEDLEIVHQGQDVDTGAGGPESVSEPANHAEPSAADDLPVDQEPKVETGGPTEEQTIPADSLPEEDAAADMLSDEGPAFVENTGSSSDVQEGIETQAEPVQAPEALKPLEEAHKDEQASLSGTGLSGFREEQADAQADPPDTVVDQTADQTDPSATDDMDPDTPPSAGPDAAQQALETADVGAEPEKSATDIDDDAIQDHAGQTFSSTDNDPAAQYRQAETPKRDISHAALPDAHSPTANSTDAGRNDAVEPSADSVAAREEKENEIGAGADSSLTPGQPDSGPETDPAADQADSAAALQDEPDDSSLADVYEALVGPGDEGDWPGDRRESSEHDAGRNSDARDTERSADTGVVENARTKTPESEDPSVDPAPFVKQSPADPPETPDTEPGAAMHTGRGGNSPAGGRSKPIERGSGQPGQTPQTQARKDDTTTFNSDFAVVQSKEEADEPVHGQGAVQYGKAQAGDTGATDDSDPLPIAGSGTAADTIPEPEAARQATPISTQAPGDDVPAPPKPLDHYALGKQAIKKKKYKQAIKHLSTIAKKAPQAPKAQYMLGALYYRMQKPEEAASHAQLALDMGVAKARDLLNKIKDDMLQAIAAKKKAAAGADAQKDKGAEDKKARSDRPRSESADDKASLPTAEHAPAEASVEEDAAEAMPSIPADAAAEAKPSVPADAALQAQDGSADAFSDYPDLSGDGVDDYLNQFQDTPLDSDFQATETFVASDAYDFFNDEPTGDTYGDTTFDRLIEGRPENAVQSAGAIQDDEPDYFALGLENLNKKKYADALENFLDARKQKPADPRVQYSLAVTYYKMYNYEDARHCAREAYRGGVKAAKKVLQKIERHKRDSKRAETTEPAANAGAMPVDLTAEADMEVDGTASINDSIVWGPNDLEGEAVNPEDTLSGETNQTAAKGEVMVFDSLSDLNAGRAAADDAAATTEADGDDSQSGGELDLEATDFDMAPPPMELSTAPDQDEVKKYLALGQKAVDKKDYLRAIKHFTKITELLPKDPLGFYNLAIISYRLNYYTTAKAHAEKALELGLPAANKILGKIESKQT